MRDFLRSRLNRSILLLGLIASPLAAKAGDPPPAVPKLTFERTDDVARWNDRSTPRKTLETLYFSILCYDLSPELIVNAIDCLDLGDFGPAQTERDGALMAHELNNILSRQDVPLYGVPDVAEGAGSVAVADEGGIKIVLERQPDGKWRFDRATVRLIPKMRSLTYREEHQTQDARSKMAAGRTDPETTVRTFFADLTRRDFTSAARCLDLQDIPPKLRASRGPELARKLAFVIERCGFLFPQEVPGDPDGWRYIWHSNHRGRIMLDRVQTSDDKAAWLFSRMTIRNLDALVRGFEDFPPDPRYARVGLGIQADHLIDDSLASLAPPADVPASLSSARATLRTFFEAMDSIEFDDTKGQTLIGCLDLAAIPEADRAAMGLRLAGKLDAVLRHFNVDLLQVSGSWESEPQSIGPDATRQVSLRKQSDGAWRFDQGSVASIPDLFDALTEAEKSARERRSHFGTARQTVRTLISSVERGDLASAADCLDLEGIPAGARGDLGPVLALKLRFVLERLGHVVIPEVPNETDGTRYYCYRGPSGRISLARRSAEPRQHDWQFTPETVVKIDSMFSAALDRPSATALADAEILKEAPGVWLRSRLPRWLRLSVLGLNLYQWLGLALVGLISAASGWAALKLLARLTPLLLAKACLNLSAAFISTKIRPLGFQLALGIFYLSLAILDLPVRVVSSTLPAIKCVWVILLAWTAIRLIDLAMAIYTNSEHLTTRRSLSDMIVPTAARCLKILVVLVAVAVEVYLIGNGESLAQLLAGLGLAGLAASLAAQDTIKSVFGTLLLIAERPFKIGDVIVVGGLEGTVEAVGFRSTKIRTLDDSLVTMPNALIAGGSIDNRGLRTYRRYREFISLAYDTPIVRLEALRDELRAWSIKNPKVRADKLDIHLNRLGDSSIDLLVSLYFRVSTYTEEQVCRDELNRAILTLAENLGVSIAFPTRTIQISHPSENAGAIPPPKFATRPLAGREGQKSELRHDL